MRLAILGVPSNSSGLLSGEARAPAALRAAGLVALLREAHDVADYGDVSAFTPTPERDTVSGIIDPETLIAMIEAVRLFVARAIADERLPVVIGGDCPLLLGCLAAARDRFGRAGLLFVDGHEDAWPPHQSTTGEAADMELGLALGLTHVPEVEALAELLPLIDPRDAIVLGPRDQQEMEEEGVSSIAGNVEYMNDRALLATDVQATVAAAVRQLHRDAGHWWFHLDLDVLSTDAMPAVSYQQPGGLSWASLDAICRAALPAPGLIGWDITIYNPDLDPDQQTARRIVDFISAVMADLP